MASNLTDQVRSISEVTKAVAMGDLGRLVNVDVQGEMLDLKMTVNQMVCYPLPPPFCHICGRRVLIVVVVGRR